MRAPLPNGFCTLAWNARVGKSADNTAIHRRCVIEVFERIKSSCIDFLQIFVYLLETCS